MSTLQTIADLQAAADLIETAGLAKGKFHDKNGCHCALGAIGIVTGYHIDLRPPTVWDYESDEDTESVDEDVLDDEGLNFTLQYGGEPVERLNAARSAVANAVGIPAFGIPNWNDRDERTQEQVVEGIRLAASQLASAEQ